MMSVGKVQTLLELKSTACTALLSESNSGVLVMDDAYGFRVALHEEWPLLDARLGMSVRSPCISQDSLPAFAPRRAPTNGAALPATATETEYLFNSSAFDLEDCAPAPCFGCLSGNCTKHDHDTTYSSSCLRDTVPLDRNFDPQDAAFRSMENTRLGTPTEEARDASGNEKALAAGTSAPSPIAELPPPKSDHDPKTAVTTEATPASYPLKIEDVQTLSRIPPNPHLTGDHVGVLPQDLPDPVQHPVLGAPFEPTLQNLAPVQDLANPFMSSEALAAPLPTDDDVKNHNTHEAQMNLAEMEAAPMEQRMSAFARLKFCDGSYYMHTYQIILGRDLNLAREDMRRIARMEFHNKKGNFKKAKQAVAPRKRRNHAPSTARSVISETGGIVNAPLNMLPLEYQMRRKSEASQSISSSSHHLSQGDSSGQQEESVDHAPQDVLMQAFPPVPQHLETMVPEDPNDCPIVPIHPQNIMAKRGHRGPKGISREHAKIYYNFEEGRFQLEVLSHNGLFHEQRYCDKGTIVSLEHGDHVMIGMVEIKFLLPDVALTDEQRAQEYAQTPSRPMSFTFENGQGESEDLIESSGSEHESVNPRHLYYVANGDEWEEPLLEEEDDEEVEEDRDSDSSLEMRARKSTPKLKGMHKVKRAQAEKLKKRKEFKKKQIPEPVPQKSTLKLSKPKSKDSSKEIPKEKGKASMKETPKEKTKEKPNELPNTPIKEESMKKPAVETKEKPKALTGEGEFFTAEDVATLGLPESMIGEAKPKRKGPGRPPKDGVMSKRQKAAIQREHKELEKARKLGLDPSELPPPVPKTKPQRPRKDSNLGEEGEEGDVRESTEGKGDAGALSEQAGEKKAAKSTKPARSPSPQMKESDFTEEQLQRPTANYVVLIHEAISNSRSGTMNLQQIYSAIERKYPYYKFRTQTNGWQSSVRHNLGQHEAFKKADKEGKGYNWVIDPKISIEKERRKRASPPPPSQPQRQGYYPPPNQYGAPHGQPGSYYPQYYPPPPAPAPDARTATPDNKPAPRLPPSLARSAPAAAPTPQGASRASPYASPWAGGGSDPNSNPPANVPRPYGPSPSAYPQSSTSASPYGMLVATSTSYQAYTTAGQYGSQYATASSAPPHSNAARPFNPYATSGPPQAHMYTAPTSAHSQHPVQSAQNRASQPPPPPSFHYPPHTSEELIANLNAFRATYIQMSPNAKEVATQQVDDAIRQIVFKQSENLGPGEQFLANAIKQIPGVRQLLASEEGTNKSDMSTDSKVQAQNGNGEAGPSKEQGTTPVGPPVGKTFSELANNAATIAASDAAVVAAGAVGDAISAVPNQNTSTANVSRPSSAHTNVGRPSVEPLTPMPGSPAFRNLTANGTPLTTQGTKRVFGEITAEDEPEASLPESKKVMPEQPKSAAEVLKNSTERRASTDDGKAAGGKKP